jgi:hypothetical protein
MGRSAAEAQQFHNSRLENSIQSARLPESRYTQTANTNQEYGTGRTANTNQEQQAYQLQQARQASIEQQAQAQTVQQQIAQLDKEIKKTDIAIAEQHNELYDFYKMLYSQIFPAGITASITVFEIADGGFITLILTGMAIAIRFVWFFMQSPKAKVWLRLRAVKQMVIASILSMIPIIGPYTQPDLISAVILTPAQTIKKIRSMTSEINNLKKKIKILKNNRLQLSRN